MNITENKTTGRFICLWVLRTAENQALRKFGGEINFFGQMFLFRVIKPLISVRQIAVFLRFYRPVEPKPPVPLTVSESSSASINSALRKGVITICASLSPGSTV